MRRCRRFRVAGLAGAALLLAVTARAATDDAETMFDEQTYQPLVAQNKTLRVGDVLTVVVQESASAASSADRRGQRNFAVSANAGSSRQLPPHALSAGASSDNDGSGSTQRSGRLLAQLSVRVTDVRPNGDLFVAGQQSLRINREEQLITLSGIIRPRDIAENNTVLSSRIADAHIRFDGKGFVTDQSKPGWLVKLFRFLGL